MKPLGPVEPWGSVGAVVSASDLPPSSTETLTGVVDEGRVLASASTVLREGDRGDFAARDRGAAEVLTSFTQRAVDGVSREGTWRTAVRAVTLLLATLLGLRVVFEGVLPTLLLVMLGGAIAVTVAWVVAHAVIEARRQRALLVALAQLSRMSRLDAASRERITPQVEAVIDALRTPSEAPWKDFLTRLRS